MDEFSQYLGDSCPEEPPAIENIEPTFSIYTQTTVTPWSQGYGSQGWTQVEQGRDQEREVPAKKGKRRSSDCEKSMYAVFFKQQQPIIKSLHPRASFGQISKLIASAWERVDGEQKKQFKVAAAAAKREEMRRRIALRTIQLCGGQH